PLAGAASALGAGWLVDRFGGRYGLVVVPSLVALIVALGVLAVAPLEGRPAVALPLIAGVAVVLIGPYTFLFRGLAAEGRGAAGGRGRGSSTPRGISGRRWPAPGSGGWRTPMAGALRSLASPGSPP